ncbi:hypothetical protein FPSE5266_20279 [Fusarium pseudograminearum]|nr:hypothetical protein FPSE5266_20279 [Fusarium pseudograminearum]
MNSFTPKTRFVDTEPEGPNTNEEDDETMLFTEDDTVSFAYIKRKNNECSELASRGNLPSLDAAIEMSQTICDELSRHSLYSTGFWNNAMQCLARRFQCTSNDTDLDKVIRMGNDVLDIGSAIDIDPKEVSELSRQPAHMLLGTTYRWRFESKGQVEDLKLAISHVSSGLLMTGWEDHDSNAADFFDLGKWNLELSLLTDDPKDVNMSIEGFEKARTSFPDRLEVLLGLARAYRLKFDMSLDEDALQHCIQILEEVIDILPPEDSELPQHHANLSYCFQKRFEISDGDPDLKLAIEALEKAHRLVAERSSVERYYHIEPIKEMTQTPEAARREHLRQEFTDMIPEETSEAAMISLRLADLSFKRWNRIHDEEDLDRCVSLFANSKALVKQGTQMSLEVAMMAITASISRWGHFKNIEDMNNVSVASRDLLDSLPDDHPDRDDTLLNLVACQINQFIDNGDPENLEQLYELTRSGLKSSMKSSRRAEWLRMSAEVQAARSCITGNASLLDDAVSLAYQSVDELRKSENVISRLLFSFGMTIARLCQMTGDIRNLDKGIELIGESIDHTEDYSQEAGIRMSDLARWHMVRGDRTGDVRDLALAIKIGEKACSIYHDPVSLLILSQCYQSRYDRLKDQPDLDKTIDILMQWPDEKNGPDVKQLRAKLAEQLGLRGLVQKNKHDSDESVALFARVLGECSKGGEEWLGYQYGLGKALMDRWSVDRESLKDIEHSIKLFNEIKDQALIPDLRGLTHYQLGTCYYMRYVYADVRDEFDLNHTMDCFLECFQNKAATLLLRIRSAANAARASDGLSFTNKALDILREAINLLPALNLRSLSVDDQQRVLESAAGLSSLATAMELKHNPMSTEALRILERGRGIISHLLTEERTMLTMLDPKLALEFTEAKNIISKMQPTRLARSDSLGQADKLELSLQLDTKARHVAETRLLEVTKRIENDPKTKHFFEPPSIREVIHVLQDDSLVVINVSDIRCDLILISRRTGIRQALLPELHLKDIKQQVDRLKKCRPMIDLPLLNWLWHVIGAHVVRGLELEVPAKHERLPRLFWILAGPLAQLPVHAAGRHHGAAKETILDRAMSSYCSSLRGFINSRATNAPAFTSEERLGKALLVAMEETPMCSPLENTTQEIDAVEALCEQLRLKTVRLLNPSSIAVLQNLDALIFHFAGHGRSEASDPSQSGLLLHDGPLTVAEIRNHKSNNKLPFISFLSACLTAANDSASLADESIHLLTACQVAGFRHLIGSIWQLYDKACVKIAGEFYKNLVKGGMVDRSVCEALHRACIRFRDAWVDETADAAAKLASIVASHEPGEVDESLPLTREEPENDLRPARLPTTVPSRAILVKADWVPYVHYGP